MNERTLAIEIENKNLKRLLIEATGYSGLDWASGTHLDREVHAALSHPNPSTSEILKLARAGYKANKVYEHYTQIAADLNNPRVSTEEYKKTLMKYEIEIVKLWDQWYADDAVDALTQEEINLLEGVEL